MADDSRDYPQEADNFADRRLRYLDGDYHEERSSFGSWLKQLVRAVAKRMTADYLMGL